MEERLQKLIAAAGLCSRRAAEELLRAGRVSVNGQTAELGGKADPEKDAVAVDGCPLPRPEKSVCILLNKPRGYVTTLSDERGRPTVAELVRDVGVRLFPVGRLDLDSEGLLLMTNDGALMQRLIHPSFEVNKTYLVTVAGDVGHAARKLSAIRELDGESIRPAEVTCLQRGTETAVLRMVIHEGKNRQIRRMCQACGLSVKRLRRIGEHTLELGELEPGKWRYLTERELQELSCRE